MIPHDIPGLVGSWRFDQDNYVAGEGFTDLSGYRNPFVLRAGAVAFETRGTREGLLLDNTNLISALLPTPYEGTIIAVFQDGIINNNIRAFISFEDFDDTVTRSGAFAAYNLTRYLNGGVDAAYAGSPSDPTTTTIAGGGVLATNIVLTFATDQTRAQCTLRVGSNADVDNTTTNIAGTSLVGPDIVIGRIRTDQADAARTALATTQRFWLRELHCYDSNLPKDSNTLLSAFVTELLA
jgi:hypothetical protein